MNIPYEAIEAAAQVLCEQMWENAHEKQRAYAREEAREALEAAVPILIASMERLCESEQYGHVCRRSDIDPYFQTTDFGDG